jgi:hypothetical protein
MPAVAIRMTTTPPARRQDPQSAAADCFALAISISCGGSCGLRLSPDLRAFNRPRLTLRSLHPLL